MKGSSLVCFMLTGSALTVTSHPKNSKMTYFKFYDKIMKKNKMKKLRTL